MRNWLRKLLAFLAVSVFIGGIYYFWFYFPIYIQIQAEETHDFGWARGEEEKYYMNFIQPVPGTPYVFCRFVIYNLPENEDNTGSYNGKFRGFLIDTLKGTCVLNGEWTAKGYLSPDGGDEHDRWDVNKVFVMDDEPIIQFVHHTRSLPPFLSYSFIPDHIRYSYAKSNSDYFYTSRSGKLEEKPKFPHHFFQIADTGNIIANDEKNMNQNSPPGQIEYAIKGNKLKKLNAWNEGLLYPQNFIPLENGNYFCSCHDFNGNNKLTFYIPGKPPKARIFTRKDLFAMLPEIEEDSTFFFSSTGLASANSNFFFLMGNEWDRFPIIKINPDRIEDGKFSDIFQFRGYIPKKKMIWNLSFAMNNEQAILSFSPLRQEKHQTAYPSYDIYSPEIDEMDDNRRFCKKIQTVDIPFHVKSLEVDKLDDQYFLIYGEGSLWKMKWDGSEYNKVFPK